jgi:SHS2 domain-containing protein
MNEKKYTVLKRTSDLSIRVQGKTQAELLSNSASALFDLMTDLEKVQVRENLPLEVEGVDRDDLIVNWIRELLYLFQGSGYLLREFKIHEARDDYVRAEVSGEKYHPDLHEILRDIRSLIYQQCRMEKTGDQWLARLSFEV